MHDHSGRGTGLTLLLLLVVALIVAWLAVTQLGSLRRPQDSAAQPTGDLLQQTQDAADALVELAYVTEPDPELTEKYEARYQQFRRIYPAMKELFPQIL